MTSRERYYQRLQRRRTDGQHRPGREGTATVGHLYLSRPALTKTNPYFDSTVVFDEAGAPTVSTFAHYGASVYDGGDVYSED